MKLAVERFNKDRHYELVARWWRARGKPVIPPSHLSTLGLVAALEGKPVAAGWLYLTDSAVCLLESYISDPASKKQERAQALDLLTGELIERAHRYGFRSVMALTQHPSISRRCIRSGFEKKGDYSMYVRKL